MKTITMVVYEAEDGWRWRAMTMNNRIIADSAEAYVSCRNAERAVVTFMNADSYPIFVSPQFGKMGNK